MCGDGFCLQTDASGIGIGTVLSVLRDRCERPVTYYRWKLSLAERNYAISEIEFLAIVAAIQHFTVYLMGVHFTVETDHMALSFLNSSKHRLARWALLLQEYNLTIKYRPGSRKANAGTLFRMVPDDVIFTNDRLRLSSVLRL